MLVAKRIRLRLDVFEPRLAVRARRLVGVLLRVHPPAAIRTFLTAVALGECLDVVRVVHRATLRNTSTLPARDCRTAILCGGRPVDSQPRRTLRANTLGRRGF